MRLIRCYTLPFPSGRNGLCVGESLYVSAERERDRRNRDPEKKNLLARDVETEMKRPI